MEINYYGLMISIGITVAFGYLAFVWYKNNFPMMWSLLFWSLLTVPIAIFGARLWTYLFHEPTRQIIDDGINFNERFTRFFGFFADKQWQLHGLSAHGAIIFSALYLLIPFTLHSNRTQISLWNYFDFAIKAALIVQIIGRWGNFFNQELLGNDYFTDNYPQKYGWIPKWFAAKIANPYNSHKLYHPIFLYESLGNAFILMMFITIPQIHKLFFSAWRSQLQYSKLLKEFAINLRKKKVFFLHRWWLLIAKRRKITILYYDNLRFTNQKKVQSRTPFRSWFWFFKGKIHYQKWTPINQQLQALNLAWYQKLIILFRICAKRDSTALSKHYGSWFNYIRSGNLLVGYLIFANLLRFGLQNMRKSHDSMTITIPLLIVFITIGLFLWFWIQFVAPNHMRSRGWMYEVLY